ncbi:MAG: hypothetical protein ACI4DU_04465 [Lachnospiraceae bacterium]
MKKRILICLVLFFAIASSNICINAQAKTPEDMIDGQLHEVECTAYSYTGQDTASGNPTVEGLTIAGAKEWIGCTCALYDEDKNFLGYYEFSDTGFGRDGDIERGETVDIYIADEQDAMEWGRKTVYIQIIPSKG